MITGGLLIIGMTVTWFLIRTYWRKTSEEAQIDTKELQILFEKAKRLLNEEKYFLNRSLKLSDLALALSCSERELSKAINHFGQSNFNKFINSFRILYSKDILIDSKFDHYTIESIAEESGFSNKVSFYNAFKKHTGLSPTAFREKHPNTSRFF